MNTDTNARLGRSSAGFGLSAAIVALFNTILACVKDAYHPLNLLMNKIAGHNWTTQGLADVILFFALGLLFSQTGLAEKILPRKLISVLVACVLIAGGGLFAWYALF